MNMTMEGSRESRAPRHGGTPLLVAIAVAIAGVLGMLIVDHGPWNKPKPHTAEMANYSTTGQSARAAGAVVLPTEPRPDLQPDAAGPKPINPPDPKR